jgi:two-component system sensor histidine kinase HydH
VTFMRHNPSGTIENWRRVSRMVGSSFHIIFPASSAVLVGVLIGRERRHRKQLEKNQYLSGLGQATAVLAHDLKTPVLTIKALITRFQNGKTTREDLAGEVNRAVTRIEQLMDSTLDLATPPRLNLREEGVAPIIKGLAQVCAAKAEEGEVTLIVDVPEESMQVEADAPCLERSLVNLVNNAIEASTNGGVVVLRARKSDAEAIVTITDHGKGIDEEALEHLFVPFYSKKDGGTGLGMAIAQKIIEAHNGRITVESEPGHRTEIEIRLPLSSPAKDH